MTLLLLFTAVISVRSTSLPQRAEPSPWKVFTPADKSFSISLPGSPRETAAVMNILGHQCPAHTIKAESNFASYIIMYTDLPVTMTDPAAIKKMFELTRQLRPYGQSSVSDDKEVSANAYAGREVTIESDRWTVRARTFLVNQRLYSVATTIRKDVLAEPQARSHFDRFSEQFFASFAPASEAKPKDGGNNQ